MLYNKEFVALDPDGEIQTNCEEDIAFHLFSEMAMRHPCVTIMNTFGTYFHEKTLEIHDVLKAIDWLENFLNQQANKMYPNPWPSEGACAEFGRVITIHLMSILYPQYVEKAEVL